MVHTHYPATIRALVVLVRGPCKGIGKAGKIHFSLSQLPVVAERAPLVD
jgi:hypothetical protein